MTQNVNGNGGAQKDRRHASDAKIVLPMSRQRKNFRLRLKSFEGSSGHVSGRSTIRAWGVGQSDASVEVYSQTHYLSASNITRAMQSWSGGCPCDGNKFLSRDRHRPTSLDFDHVGPSDGDLFDGIADDNSALFESDFRFNEKEIEARHNECGDESARDLRTSTTLVEARPHENRNENKSHACQDKAGLRAVDVGLVHAVILSQMSYNSFKAVH